MSRGIYLRVNSFDSVRILALVFFSVNVINADKHSCYEVRAAFQQRHVGPLHLVPEKPYKDADLQICKHQGPSCCNKKMEECYQAAVKRETLQKIESHTYQLEHLLSGHSDTFKDMFQYLLSFSQGHLSSLLEGTYSSLSHQALPHVNQLFSSLSLFLRGANVSVELTVHRFFNNIFPLVYTRFINPGIEGSVTASSTFGDCLRMIRQDVKPFGNYPVIMAQELAELLEVGRQLGLALNKGLEVINATEHVNFSRDCVKGLAKMVYCSHCRGLTLIKPCAGYCLNVMRGCLASMSELDQPWRIYISFLEKLTIAMAGHHSLELAILGVRGRVNGALLYAQNHGPLITATVDKVCGLPTGEPPGMRPTSPEFTTSTTTSTSPPPSASAPSSQLLPEEWLDKFAHLKSPFPLKPSKNNKPNLRTLSWDFLRLLQRYKPFFITVPEMLCEGEYVVDDSTCWGGDGVVESYISRIVGNGLDAQRQNPEVKVRSLDPTMAELKKRLELFNRETQEKFPDLIEIHVWEELGSGEEHGSTADCDDEDGCQSSGDDVNGRTSNERQPGGDNTQENLSKPPAVKVVGGSPTMSWQQPGCLVLLVAGLCLKWMMF
ncbi:glypican-5 isoform X3 [Girardinichthys multiradiatus]|uniref:glypican-5 isoform X3 n=1 Tax=Girardinichthys multiradiatus TaxID=208333 RepID=UPI001FABC6F8|nr:glypican-5 isoform X3 [Girardinichthys multiradiatus]